MFRVRDRRRRTFRGRRSHAEKRPSEERAGGRRDGGCARDEVEDGIGIANIPLLRLSPVVASLTDLSLRSSIDPLALTPERVRGAYRQRVLKNLRAGRQIVRFRRI